MFNKILFIQFGKFKSKSYAKLFSEYVERLSHYVKIEIKEIKIDRDHPEYFIKIKDKIENLIKGTTVITFSEKGELLDSFDFSNFIDRSSGILSIIVGSSWGLPSFLESFTQKSLSLGRMTLAHEAVRVLAAEQLYRAYTIIKKEKYHK